MCLILIDADYCAFISSNSNNQGIHVVMKLVYSIKYIIYIHVHVHELTITLVQPLTVLSVNGVHGFHSKWRRNLSAISGKL